MTGGNMMLLSAGRRVSLLRGFQESFSNRDGCVYAGDMDPGMSAACQVAEQAFRLPPATGGSYIEELTNLCVSEDIRLLVPTIDTELEVLSRSREQLEARGIQVVISDMAVVEACRDKRNTANFFRANGLSTPTIFEPDGLSFPLLAKPFDGSLSADIHLVRDRSELTDVIIKNPRMIFCEYIDHDYFDEFTCDLYYSREHTLRCVVPRQRLVVRGGEVAKARALKNEIVELLFGSLGYLEGARGCLTLQLFRNPETLEKTCIEINARFGGGYPLARHAGANFQQWIVDEYLDNKPVDTFLDWADRLTMLRYDAEVIV